MGGFSVEGNAPPPPDETPELTGLVATINDELGNFNVNTLEQFEKFILNLFDSVVTATSRARNSPLLKILAPKTRGCAATQLIRDIIRRHNLAPGEPLEYKRETL